MHFPLFRDFSSLFKLLVRTAKILVLFFHALTPQQKELK